jgi:three-Cys-motif partner protein
MTKPSATIWKIEPHTQAKHDILGRYLSSWFGILGQRIPRIMYLDGFCGPGRYEDGEDGSPIIALKEALKHGDLLRNTDIIFFFIDERQDRIEHLKQEISLLQIPPNFKLIVQTGEFQHILEQEFDRAKQNKTNLVPTFAFVDPFGFKGVPFDLIKQLLNNPRTEVFINVMIDFVNRFIEHPNSTVQQHIIDLFGTPNALNVIQAGGDREENLRRLYLKQLQPYARFIRYFEMQDEFNRAIYYLFFATNHPLGFTRMKEAFWKVDPDSGFKFSDATNPSQMVLFRTDPIPALARLIAQKYVSQSVITDQIRCFVEEETIYVTSHMKKALMSLEAEERIKVDALKIDSKKRIKNSFPDGVKITFL